MLTGFQHDDEIIVVAASDLEEFDKAPERFNELGVSFVEPELMEFFSPKLSGFGRAYILKENNIGINIVPRVRAIDLHKKMIEDGDKDLFSDPRPVGEIFNIPAPEDKTVSENKKTKESTSGESFSGKKKGPIITDVTASVDADGKVKDIDVVAVKNSPEKEVEEQTQVFTDLMVTCDKPILKDIIDLLDLSVSKFGQEWAIVENRRDAAQLVESAMLRGGIATVYNSSVVTDIDPEEALGCGRGPFSMFYRLDISSVKLDRVVEILKAGELSYSNVIAVGETINLCWVATTVERIAMKLKDAIVAEEPSAKIEVYAVNPRGQRLAPDGVTVVDTNDTAQYGPRPWDEDLSAWNALTDEEREQEKKKITGREFLFTGSWAQGKGTTVYFTPRAYFERMDAPWTGDVVPYMGHLIPASAALVHEKENIYTARSLSYDHAVLSLARAKFVESTFYRLFLNCQ